jgi:light-regulated signal transduction histidine kinase (bacteriophytochrome)
MQKLIEDLLAFSRVATRGRPFEPIDLNALTREVLVDLSDQVSRASAVVRVGELPTISADELQVRQLIQNMVSNALKFRREDVVPEVTIDATVTDEETRISVRDNGIGFEDQYADRIFRIFERLHGRGSYPGTGIGLALCRKIAERHGGTVIAESEAGVGSTFTAILAVRQEDAAAAARTVATNGGGDSHIQESEEAQVDVVG